MLVPNAPFPDGSVASAILSLRPDAETVLAVQQTPVLMDSPGGGAPLFKQSGIWRWASMLKVDHSGEGYGWTSGCGFGSASRLRLLLWPRLRLPAAAAAQHRDLACSLTCPLTCALTCTLTLTCA